MQPLKPLYKKMDRCIRLLEELNLQVRDIRRKNAAFERAQAALSEEMAKAREIELAELAAVSVPGKQKPEEVNEIQPEDAPKDTQCDAAAELLNKVGEVCETCNEDCSECEGYNYGEILTTVTAQRPAAEIKRGYNVDKYGRVYTEEEIQRLIAD